MRLSDFSWDAAVVWTACASVGTARIAADRTVRVAISLARGESKLWRPCLTPPAMKASPSTSTLFAITDPTSAD